mmetsp:Transcript_16529/g.34901  ORF Transcript_16529/g.34901 Transcript_16529/m.34901 type:complete len:1041 (+) Transcript_16529:174-3296(+)
MQFRRKKANPNNGNKNALRVIAILIIGGVGLFCLFSNDDDYGYTIGNDDVSSTDGTFLRSGSLNEDAVGESRQQGMETRDNNDIKSPSSLLNSPEALRNLPACEAIRHALPGGESSSSAAAASSNIEFDASRPAIFTNWNPAALGTWSDRAAFANRFGNHAQYVKGRDVQPYKDGEGKACTASTRTLMDAMEKLFRKNNSNSGNDATSNPQEDGNNHHGHEKDLLFFTNDIENPSFLRALSKDYSMPPPLANLPPFSNSNNNDNNINDNNNNNSNEGTNGVFQVFSAMERGSSHPFHYHDAAWLGQVSGSRLWYFLPPNTPRRRVGSKVNGCDYLSNAAPLPKGATACVQKAGEVMYFPERWLHATCALEPWSVGIGGQAGSPSVYDQNFDNLLQSQPQFLGVEQKKIVECGVLDETDYDSNTATASEESGSTSSPEKIQQRNGDSANRDWTFYNGDLNEYYNKLERDEHAKRNPNKITSYAVHRWMGPKGSTLVHYELVRGAIHELILGKVPPPPLGDDNAAASNALPSSNEKKLRVFDAGCGLGAGLMWFEQHEPAWDLVGHTISEEQHKWIAEDLPRHDFRAKLRTYDKPLGDNDEEESPFHAVYSIEAAIHSPDLRSSLRSWSRALRPGGVIIVIDDFLNVGVSADDPDVELFKSSWIANSVHTTVEIATWAEQEMDMVLVRDRDLGSEYRIIQRNYRNKKPELRDEQGRVHQGWLGSKVRQRLMVDGKISYRLIALQKKGTDPSKDDIDSVVTTMEQSQSCSSVPSVEQFGAGSENPSTLSITIDPILMSGKGKKGGEQMACISGWYCCDQGANLWDELEQTRTDRTGFLKLPRELFGHYLTSFSKHLTDFYRTYPSNYPEGEEGKARGIFLDIGGTGSVASGMQQVSSKFSNFAGPLKYWVLDSDPAAKKLTNALVCDIDDCSEASDCGYDVTFSHTVLEHAARPWKSFDTIARITKRGGLTLHLVPWSYQYHATPDDNYRFSHKALTTLLEDRGFEVLDVGYDVCTQPEHMLKTRKDEHFEVIWLTYVVGRKL